MGLLEISPTSTCDANEDLSIFGLSLALAAEYIIDLVNGTDSALSVPGVQYGRYLLVPVMCPLELIMKSICSFETR